MDVIIDGAARALEEKGADFTMDYLAKSIRISKRTIYEKFNSKEEIIALIFKIKMQDIHEQHRQVLADETLSLEEKLVGYFTVRSRVFNIFETDKIRLILEKVPVVISKLQEDISNDWDLLYKFLEGEIEKGNIKQIDINTFILIFQSLNYQMLEYTDYTFSQMHEVLKQAIKQLLYGIKID